MGLIPYSFKTQELPLKPMGVWEEGNKGSGSKKITMKQAQTKYLITTSKRA